jgi:type IV pilus assembly protein PilA
MVIVAILAAIAIPQFLQYRDRAWRSAVRSDLSTAALHLTVSATDSGGQYPVAVPADMTFSPGVAITLGISASTSRICLKGDHAALGESHYYDSDAGGLTTVPC